ncbi:MAG: HdeD family acid-resistance protein [Lachnospiraceae bacterium]
MTFFKKNKGAEQQERNDSFKEKEIRKKLVERKLTKVVSSLLFIVIGLVLIIWRDPALTVICTILGALLCAAGVVGIVMYFVTKERSFASTAILAIGVVAAVVGLYLALNPAVLMAIVPAVVGILIVISGIINLSESVTIKKENGDGFVLSLILSLITVALGVLIILKPSILNNIILVLMGISLVYDGVSNLIIIAGISGMVREAKTEYKKVRQDADAIDVTGGYTEVSHKAPAPEVKTDPEPEKKEPEKEPEAGEETKTEQ